MLNLISPADASPERMRSGLGTWLNCGSTPVPSLLADRIAALTAPSGALGIAMPFARPKPRETVDLLGYGAQAAGQVKLTRQQRTSKVQNAHTTRIAARISSYIKGGAPSGPHPARDPV